MAWERAADHVGGACGVHPRLTMSDSPKLLVMTMRESSRNRSRVRSARDCPTSELSVQDAPTPRNGRAKHCWLSDDWLSKP